MGDALVSRRDGEGPEVLLVHGGASPGTTFRGLEGLSARWTVVTVWRRGFGPSPPPVAGYVDWEQDAADLAPLLASRPHVIAHSYGAVGVMVAAAAAPDSVRSLSLLEPAILPLDDAGTREFRRVADATLANGLDADLEDLRTFLRFAGSPVPDAGPLPDVVVQAVQRAHHTRSPYLADLRLDLVAGAGIPSLVASGGHADVAERNADAVAESLGARRIVRPGAGHFVAAAPGCAEALDRFMSQNA